MKANASFEEYFGSWQGKHCYEVYKGVEKRCDQCRALAVFQDGATRISDETGVDRHGRTCHYILHQAPLRDESGEVAYVLEMSRDVTETKRWQREYDILFDRVPCYVTVIDRDLKIIRANEKFRNTFGEGNGNYCYAMYKRRETPCSHCPALLTFQDGQEHDSERIGITREGEQAHYVVTTAPLSRGDGEVEHVIEIALDVTQLKKLEKEKRDTERLAAVGQTVAGLAHTIKNLLMGLEGGMYMVDTGIKKGRQERIERGWEVLQRNFDKTTDLVRGFLNFAKGRVPKLELVDPARVPREIHDLYSQTAAQQGVAFSLEVDEGLAPIPLDPEGMEACLTNLISNAIDAALLREDERGAVVLEVSEDEGWLHYTVRDNGSGMDDEVKQKIFTTFFTTKGGEGTGLGLLTTRKIVHEHGGVIDVQTTPGEGSVFTIRLPREKLQAFHRAQQKRFDHSEDEGEP